MFCHLHTLLSCAFCVHECIVYRKTPAQRTSLRADPYDFADTSIVLDTETLRHTCFSKNDRVSKQIGLLNSSGNTSSSSILSPLDSVMSSPTPIAPRIVAKPQRIKQVLLLVLCWASLISCTMIRLSLFVAKMIQELSLKVLLVLHVSGV